MHWNAPPKPAEFAESQLIEAILEGHFPAGSTLPAERELALQLGVTRPTLRETLQRLARDGWLEIRHGKPTRVQDYLHEGNLGVLGALARRSNHLPADFIPHLLAARQVLAPAYTRLAVERDAAATARLLEKCHSLEDTPAAYAAFDWRVHHTLTVISGNPIFTLILNGFSELYQPMACLYFQTAPARAASLAFYQQLLVAAEHKDAVAAEGITRQVMQNSLEQWHRSIKSGQNLPSNRGCKDEGGN